MRPTGICSYNRYGAISKNISKNFLKNCEIIANFYILKLILTI